MPKPQNPLRSPINPLAEVSAKPAKTPVPLCTTAEGINSTIRRLGLTDNQAAGYFGVPVFTLRKWRSGEREPGAVVARLAEVLGLVEALCPGLHCALVPAPAETARRGRPVSNGKKTMPINPV